MTADQLKHRIRLITVVVAATFLAILLPGSTRVTAAPCHTTLQQPLAHQSPLPQTTPQLSLARATTHQPAIHQPPLTRTIHLLPLHYQLPPAHIAAPRPIPARTTAHPLTPASARTTSIRQASWPLPFPTSETTPPARFSHPHGPIVTAAASIRSPNSPLTPITVSSSIATPIVLSAGGRGFSAQVLPPPPPGRAGCARVRDEPGRFVWPLETAPQVGRPFDPPPGPYAAGHRGVDLVSEPGATVVAAGDGVVVFAGRVVDRGVVALRHGGGLRTSYEPVVASVEVGARVRAGQAIGVLVGGHRGCPAAACLHWGLRREGVYLDPLLALVPLRVRLLPH